MAHAKLDEWHGSKYASHSILRVLVIAVDDVYFLETVNRMPIYNDLLSAVIEQNVILQIAACDDSWAGD